MLEEKESRAKKGKVGSKKGVSRRDFLRASSFGIGLIVVPGAALGLGKKAAPSSRITLAGIGVGGVGYGHLQACEKSGFEVLALCDVDSVLAAKAFRRWPEARRYVDFREMLEAEDRKIDAVYIATPDHSHAVITMAALRKRKHVCCVKPLTRTIHECRTVVAKAKEVAVATQVTASPNTGEVGCRTCELIWAGAIGGVRQVHVWTNRPLWPQGMERPSGSDPVPDTLNWDLWIGPAQERPFKNKWPEGHYCLKQIKVRSSYGKRLRAVYHPWNFRGWWAFGTGALGDMGCHLLNVPFRALKLTHPVRIRASATKVFPETAPLSSIVTFDFPARGDMPPVQVIWYDGGLKPPAPPELGSRPLPSGGVIYVGDKGVMLGTQVFPEERARKFKDVPRTLERRSGVFGEWIEACKGGPEAGCNFQWAGLLTECVLLGNIAIRTREILDWDGKLGRFLNSERANSLLRERYREGWGL